MASMGKSINSVEIRRALKGILKGADLNTLSSKKARKQLEEKFGTDLTDRKKEIDSMLMEMITASSQEETADSDKESNHETAESDEENKQDGSASESKDSSSREESGSDSEDDESPPPKKKSSNSTKKPTESKNKKAPPPRRKVDNSDSEVDDEAYAKKLQEEELSSRRRAVKRRPAPGKKEPKEKRKSDKPRQKKETAYTRKCLLSPELAGLVGANEMARHDVVKKMWEIARERNLFDPTNKQYAIFDNQLQNIFGVKRVRMFAIMKYLKNHIKDQKHT
ncbi:uncharacterized protein LOC143254093 [Tachypleus tridentatus]|uniref:uncharacterized protein LOC143254093 n=1 Tax=Tachypleus tridentatus TaxID=6853 RepID=UPI003FD0825A